MKLTKDDIKLGDTVEYYITPPPYGNISATMTNQTVMATVIALHKHDNKHCILGWKSTPPGANCTKTSAISSAGWALYDKISNFSEYTDYQLLYFSYEVKSHNSSSPTAAIQTLDEKPCSVCSAPNDVGVKVCWRCGSLDPTDSGAVSAEAKRRGYV
jgi:hypothetical protein